MKTQQTEYYDRFAVITEIKRINVFDQGTTKTAAKDYARGTRRVDPKARLVNVRVVVMDKPKAGPWKVEVKGSHTDNEDPGHEISVIHEKYKHGFDSWGWDGENKLIVSTSTEDCGKDHFNMMVQRARIIANSFNSSNVPYTGE